MTNDVQVVILCLSYFSTTVIKVKNQSIPAIVTSEYKLYVQFITEATEEALELYV